MSEEEKKAIDRLGKYKEKIKDELYPIIDFEEEKALGIILNLIKKQQEQLQEKDKAIQLMAEVLNDFDYDKQCESCPTNICSASVDETGYTKCIIEYFTKKAREE